MYTLIIFILCLKSVYSASILGVFLFPSISHQTVYQQIYRELSLRGHKVTVITPDPLNDPSLTNLTEISVRFIYELKKGDKVQKLYSKDANMFQNLDSIFHFVDSLAEAELSSPEVKELISGNNHFDLIILEYFHPALQAFSFRFKAPLIGVSSLGGTTPIHGIVGNPTHPYLYPHIFLNIKNEKLTLWERIQSVAFDLYSKYYHHYVYTPRAQIIAEKFFGKNIPYVGDLEKNMSLLFLNVNPFLYTVRPIVPAVIELGFMHIQSARPLSEDLKTILDESPQGVIYFSLGSNIKSIDLCEKLRKVITETFSELSYTILWKFENDSLKHKPKNLYIRKWWPQQDILAHPNIKLFITQGGLQSIEEAISRGVPLLALPFIGDQTSNVQKIVNLGIGIRLNPATLAKSQFKSKIIEVAENPNFKTRIMEIQNVALDRPMTGLEKAVWWSEYVIRNKGAKYLRSPSADISWFEYYLLDIILGTVFILLCFIYIFYKLLLSMKIHKKMKIL